VRRGHSAGDIKATAAAGKPSKTKAARFKINFPTPHILRRQFAVEVDVDRY
jgi:hypothetical protein